MRLREDDFLRRLPAKFGFLIDGGGVLPLGDVEADIRFEALRSANGTRVSVALAGADDVAAQCAPEEVPDVAATLARAFLRDASSADDAPRRMRELVLLRGPKFVFARAGVAPIASPAPLRRRGLRRGFLGVHAFGASLCIGAALPFGRTDADGLRFLSRQARRCSAGDIRLTPWRACIVGPVEPVRAETLAARLAAGGFILDASDPRLAIAVCAGAPACANARRDVRADALEFASSLGPSDGIVLHVSGCEKGCAHGRAAPYTLVARNGGYDLIVNGKASGKPSRESLSVREAASLMTREYGMLSR